MAVRDGCAEVLRATVAEHLGFDVTVSTEPPLVAGPYTRAAMVCPHGIKYWTEPTGEQIAQWARDGVK